MVLFRVTAVCVLSMAAANAAGQTVVAEMAAAKLVCDAVAQPIMAAGQSGIDSFIVAGQSEAARAAACSTFAAAMRACRLAAASALGLPPPSPAAVAVTEAETRAFLLAHGWPTIPPCF